MLRLLGLLNGTPFGTSDDEVKKERAVATMPLSAATPPSSFVRRNPG